MAPAVALAEDARLRQPPRIWQPQQRRNFAAIDHARKQAKISLAALWAESGVDMWCWYDGKAGRCRTRDTTLARLWAALTRLNSGAEGARPPAAIAALVRAAEEILRARLTDPALIKACNPVRAAAAEDDRKMPAGRLRILAIYLVAVELELGNAGIARALGCKRENVRKARVAVEDLREDGLVDRLLTQCAALMKGDK